MEGMGVNGKHLGSAPKAGTKKKRWVLVKSRQTRIWVSIIECISAEGNWLPLVVIFIGAFVQEQWFP